MPGVAAVKLSNIVPRLPRGNYSLCIKLNKVYPKKPRLSTKYAMLFCAKKRGK